MLRAFLLSLLLASLGACGDDDYGIDGLGPARDMSVADATADLTDLAGTD
jgi:hypothetical protein